jgi:8-oxo-dGTP pyrophosphatase MutT (NUDIX family)
MDNLLGPKGKAEALAKGKAPPTAPQVHPMVADFNPPVAADVLDAADYSHLPGWGKPPSGKSQSYGVVLFNNEGKVLLRAPTDNYGGAAWTWPKGGGPHTAPATTALKELAEETGWGAELVDVLPDAYTGTTTKTNYYLGKATTQNLALMDKETAGLKWVDYDEAKALIIQSPDPKVVARDLATLDDAFGVAKQQMGMYDADNWAQVITKAPPKAPGAPSPAGPAADAPGPAMLARLRKVRDLSGSTKPIQAVDPDTGLNWVVKAKLDPGHVRSEVQTDRLYQTIGAPVPKSYIIETAEGPTKVSEWLEGGETLADWMRGKSAAQVAEMDRQIARHFVADALFANHDVAGLANDNIFIVGGKAYRIDNGGGLTYRAQGLAKRDFGSEVKELATMRDANLNANTARIYAHLTQADIHQQIETLLLQRAAILGAIDDPTLRNTIAARLDWLEDQLPAKPKAKAAKRGGNAAYTVDQELAAKVQEARLQGRSLAADKGLVEDNTILFTEFTRDGQTVTRATLKVTREGGAAIADTLGKLGANIPAPKLGAATGHAPQWETLITAIKNINYKVANGGEFNTTKVNAALGASMQGLDAAEAAYYKAIQQQIAKAVADKTALPNIRPYKRPEATTTPKPKAQATIRQTKVVQPYSKFKNGRATIIRDQELEIYGTEVTMPDGTKFQYVPPTAPGETGAYAGLVEFEMPGAASPATMKRVLAALEDMGVPTAPPSPEWEEALYIHKTITKGGHAERGAAKTTYEAIWGDPTLSDAQRVVAMKAWVKKNMGVDLEAAPPSTYQPAGRADYMGWGTGDGWRVWDRWDIPDKDWEKFDKDYVLVHTMGGALTDTPRGTAAGTIEAFLSSGGEFTSNTNRTRKGVDAFLGASPTTDRSTGGADFFFTRLKNKNTGVHGLYFKPQAARRVDAVHYDGDKYGNMDPSVFAARAKTVQDMKSFAPNTSNEFIFKHGLGFGDLDYIKVHDAAEREDVLAVLRKNKITHHPDGRPIEDIVVY